MMRQRSKQIYWTTKEIAERLNISKKSVRTFMESLRLEDIIRYKLAEVPKMQSPGRAPVLWYLTELHEDYDACITIAEDE